MKSQSNSRTIVAFEIRLGKSKLYSARVFCLGSRASWEWGEWVWGVVAGGVPPVRGSRQRRRRRPLTPTLERERRAAPCGRRVVPNPASDPDGRPSSPAGSSGGGGTGELPAPGH